MPNSLIAPFVTPLRSIMARHWHLPFVGMMVALTVVCLTTPAKGQSLEARPDTMTVPAAGLVFHASEFLLGNDGVAPDDSLRVILVSQPSNGTLTDLGNGFFHHDPNSGFLGEDRFRYSLETVPIQRLTIDATVSALSFDATVETALGVADDQEEIPVEGTVLVDLGSDPVGIDSVHVLDVSMQNQGPHSLNFNYGSPISIGSLRIIADPGSVQLGMLSPGPTSGVSGLLNSWEQLDNLVRVSVTAMLEGGGLITNQVPDTPQELETETTEALSGAVFVSGGQVLFLLNVASSNAFELEGNAVTLDIDGALQASGAFVGVQTSNETEVLVQVVSGASVDQALATRGFELDVYPMPVRDQLTVRLQSRAELGFHPVEITVYDVLGRVVERLLASPNMSDGEMRASFDTSNWASGLYLVRVSGGGKSLTRSVIRH